MRSKSVKVSWEIGEGALPFSVAEKAEDLTDEIEQATAEADVRAQELAKMLVETSPDLINTTVNTIDLYKHIMYFVDGSKVGVPATCTGALLGTPMIASLDGCAKACEHRSDECAGFTWFDNWLCFTFSELREVMYYTGCDTSFLQDQRVPTKHADLQLRASAAQAAPRGAPAQPSKSDMATEALAATVEGTAYVHPDAAALCYAKFSRFTGTTLKPDPSGKCKQCLKKATKADRC